MMMSAKWILAALLLTAGGCVTLTEFGLDGGDCTTDGGDMTIPLPDLSLPAAKCAAAKGLSGDNLLCVDFDKVTQLTDAALAGWNFNANMANCWQITGGALQVANFGSFVGNCGVTLPAIDLKQADKQKYQRVTLAILHRVDLSDIDQQAQVFIDIDNPATRLIHQTTSRPAIPTLTTTVLTINKADLPVSLMNTYKFFLKVGSSSISGRQGWQIQSIAVMGN